MTAWIPSALLGFILGLVAFRFWYVRWKEKRIEEKRVVEKPNSHYAPEAVKNLEAQERWERIDLDALHELNRSEVEALLERVHALGIKSLRPQERAFLERMVEAVGTV